MSAPTSAATYRPRRPQQQQALRPQQQQQQQPGGQATQAATPKGPGAAFTQYKSILQDYIQGNVLVNSSAKVSKNARL